MGTRYTAPTVLNYNAAPPSDDGTVSSNNQVSWAKLLSKVGNPLKTYAEAINTQLVAALSTDTRSVTASEALGASDHLKTVVVASTVTATITLTLADAVTMANGYMVTLLNQSNVAHTIGRATSSNTINGATFSVSLLPMEAITFVVNPSANGYFIASRSETATSFGGEVSIFQYMNAAQISDVQAGTLSLDLSSVFATVAVAARGKSVRLPKGKYLINTDGGSVLLEEIRFVGEQVLDGATDTLDQGSILCMTGTTNSPFKVRRGVTLEGLGWFYPNQTDSATPVAYPPMVDFDFGNGPVQFVNFTKNVVYNAYRVIRIGDTVGNVGNVWITDNNIYGINSCIELSHNLEVIKITGNSFTFGHWLAATEAGCRGYTRANGVVFTMPKSDGFIFSGNMAYGYFRGVYFNTTGLCQLFNIQNNLFDQVRYCIEGTGTGNLAGAQIVGNSFLPFSVADTTAAGTAIKINTSGALNTEIMTITGNTFSTCTESEIDISGDTAVRALTISANTFAGWAAYKASGNYPAVKINGASTSFTLTGNYFVSQTTYGSGLYGSASAAVITGNSFLNCISAINASYNTGTCVGNASYATLGSFSDLTSGLAQYGNVWDKPQSWLDTATAATYTLSTNVKTVICNRAGTITVTLPTAAANAGRRVKFRTITANTVVSASSNVVPIAGGAAGTAMLAASSGAWCELECDGTSWQIIAA